jgi:hypothetical protein
MAWMTRVALVSVLIVPSVARAADCTAVNLAQLGLPGSPSAYVRSAAHDLAGRQAASFITPRDASGVPAPTGKIVFLGIGMSNGEEIHKAEDLIRTRVEPYKSASQPSLVVVLGDQFGQTAEAWRDPLSPVWAVVLTELTKKKVTAAQVQAVQIVMAQQTPSQYGPLTAAALQEIVTNVKVKFPNTQVGWLSGLNYTGYSNRTGNTKQPEPSPHDDSLLMALMVETTAWAIPWVGFYDLWADGTTVNPLTGLSYVCSANLLVSDVKNDGVHLTHPSSPPPPPKVGDWKVGWSVLDRLWVDHAACWMWTAPCP